MDRQGSILSTQSDYDILDPTQDETDDGTSDAVENQSYLKQNKDIYVKVKVRESHGLAGTGVLSSTRLYDVECFHGHYQWRIIRNYGHFEELHRVLTFFRASLRLNRTEAKGKKKKKDDDGTPASSGATGDNGTQSESQTNKGKVSKIKSKALKFPKKPDIFVFSAVQVERRRQQLEIYLNAVLQDTRYRTHDATMRFVEVSPLSFIKRSGEKFLEGYIKKRSGGRRFPTLLSCFAPSAALWNKRWLVLKDSYLCYLRSNNQIADVMLIDQDFDEVKAGLAFTKIHHGLIITNTTRELALKTNNYHKTRNWVNAIQPVAEACEYKHPTPHHSFAPTRKELAHWYVDAVHYFEDVASALESAREQIFITDWWLTPELFLRRPVIHMTDPSRLDNILHKKAEEGVKIYILLYKEIEMAVGGIQSFKCKSRLESLHPNIMVMRHPDHFSMSVYFWSHHEKIVCVDQAIAFLGGLDLCFGRWDTAEHRLTDLGSVQTVTPPQSRAGTMSTKTEDWKGCGVEDQNKLRKKQESSTKDTKKQLRHSQTTPNVGSHPTFTLGDDLQPLAKAVNRRPHSVSDLEELKLFQVESRLEKCKSWTVSHMVDTGEPQSILTNTSAIAKTSKETKGATGTSCNTEGFSLVVHKALVEHRKSLSEAADQNGSSAEQPGEDLDNERGGVNRPYIPQIIVACEDSQGEQRSEATPAVGVDDIRPELLTMKSGGTDSEFDSINSEVKVVPFKTVPSAGGLSSTGFGDKSSYDRLSTVEELDLAEKRHLADPLKRFSHEEKSRRKKSRGKIPNPPPKNAYWEMVANAMTAVSAMQDRKESAVAEAAPSRQRSPWKKIRCNIDKVKRVWKHEESMRDPSLSGSPQVSRKSSLSSMNGVDASKYWMGKDYVNWLFKDLASVEAPFRDSVDRFSTARMPWHDIACVLFNKAATDVGRHFIQRWNFAKKVKASSKSNNKYPLLLPRSTNVPYKRLPPFIRERCELVNCQILRSSSGWSTGMQEPENSIHNAYISLIRNSEHYIYIENQFFISCSDTEVENCLSEAIINRILKAHEENQTFRVYLVLPLLPAFEANLDPHKSGGSPLFSILHYVQQSLTGHENSLFSKLSRHGLDPNRYLSVCGLRNHGMLNQAPVTELVYVHSKLMIVDDTKCIIGSANINDRSLLGDRDSEIAVVIEDDLFRDSKMSGEDYKAGKFCYSLRNQLFQEHLGLRSDEFIDDVTSEEFYKKHWITTAVLNTDTYGKVFNCLPCDSVASFNDLRAYRQETPLAVSDPVSAKKLLLKIKGKLVMYPLYFLKNENLQSYSGAEASLVPAKFWT